MKNNEKKEKINYKVIFIATVFSTTVSLLLISAFRVFEELNLLDLLRLVTRTQIESIEIPQTEFKTEHISSGLIVQEEKTGIKREIIVKTITTKEKTLLGLSGSIRGECDFKTSEKKEARVLVMVYIDDILYSMDSDSIQTGTLTKLAGNATVKRVLQPGEHTLKVEGIFTGPLHDTNTALYYALISNKKMKLKIPKKIGSRQ